MQTAGEWTPFEGIDMVALISPATNTSDVNLIREDEDGTCIQLPTKIFAIGHDDLCNWLMTTHLDKHLNEQRARHKPRPANSGSKSIAAKNPQVPLNDRHLSQSLLDLSLREATPRASPSAHVEQPQAIPKRRCYGTRTLYAVSPFDICTWLPKTFGSSSATPLLPELCKVTLPGIIDPEPQGPPGRDFTVAQEYPDNSLAKYEIENFVLSSGMPPQWHNHYTWRGRRVTVTQQEDYLQSGLSEDNILLDDPKLDFSWDEFDDRSLLSGCR